MADLFSDIGGLVGGISDKIAGPLVGGGMSLLGGLFQNQAAASSIQQQEAFQAQQSGSVAQRSVADLKAAGLNPILAAGGSIDTAASGSSFMPQNVLGGAASSALQTMQVLQGLKETQSAIEKNYADIDVKAAQQYNIEANTKLLSQSLLGAKAGYVPAKQESDFYARHPNMRAMGLFLQTILGPLLHGSATAMGMGQTMNNITKD